MIAIHQRGVIVQGLAYSIYLVFTCQARTRIITSELCSTLHLRRTRHIDEMCTFLATGEELTYLCME
jgi:hypothetical protein